ncbi:MAG: YARHG domain-containing protein [Myxococcales bacterium]|nr:YARHG domain-containing protein [Myxococcales bacterium]MCB9643453.1 YARHG domain-containing protein [Myxococcales bacterium]
MERQDRRHPRNQSKLLQSRFVALPPRQNWFSILGISLGIILGASGCKKEVVPPPPKRPQTQQPLAPPATILQQPIDTPRPTEAAKRFEQAILQGSLQALQPKLSDDQLAGLSVKTLYLAQQTCLARHQQRFKRDWVRRHFARFTWYKEQIDDAQPSLSPTEQANYKRITYHLDRALERVWLGKLEYRLIEDKRDYSFCGDRLYALSTQTGSPDGSCCLQKAYGYWTFQDGHLYLQQVQRCEGHGSGTTEKSKDGACIRYASCKSQCKPRRHRHLLLERRSIFASLLHNLPISGALQFQHQSWKGAEDNTCDTARRRLGLPSRTQVKAPQTPPTPPQVRPTQTPPTQVGPGQTTPSQPPPRPPQPTQWASDAITGPTVIFDGWWAGDHRYVMSFHAFGEPNQKIYWSRQCTFTRGGKQRQTSHDKKAQLRRYGWHARTTVAYSRPDERGSCRFSVQIGMMRQQKLIHFPREDSEGARNHIRFFYRWYKRNTRARQLAVVLHVQTRRPKQGFRWEKRCNLLSAAQPDRPPYKYRESGRDTTNQFGWGSRLILLTTHTDYDGPCAISVSTPELSRVFHHKFLLRDDMKD